VKTTISLMLWLIIPVALIGAPITAFVLGTERQPMIVEINQLSGDDLERAASLLLRYDPAQMAMGETTTIVAREDELNSALTAGLADYHPISGRVAVEASSVRIEATAELPEVAGVMGHYVNIVASIAPSRQGLDIISFRIGKIGLPKSLTTLAMQVLLEALLGPGKGAHIIENIKSVDISGKTVAIGYRSAGRDARLVRSDRRQDAYSLSTPDQPRVGYSQADNDAEGIKN
jgi:hypothetical protein